MISLEQIQVSIRARHCWRAILRFLPPWQPPKLFQSAPAIAGGRSTQAVPASLTCTVFQSAHAIAGGRSAAVLAEQAAAADVSIRARHCWRAILPAEVKAAAVMGFQSAPAIAGGRSSGHPARRA